MTKNTQKFEIKIDPLDFHVGLKDNMAEFESLIRMENPGKRLAEKINEKLSSRFCHCCFFGHVEGELMGEPLCKECAKILYGFDAEEERPSIKKIDPYYQLWYRRQKALPIFEAYLHSELELFKLEKKLEEARATVAFNHLDAVMRERRLRRALWIARAKSAKNAVTSWCRECMERWNKVERKCQIKSEEYK